MGNPRRLTRFGLWTALLLAAVFLVGVVAGSLTRSLIDARPERTSVTAITTPVPTGGGTPTVATSSRPIIPATPAVTTAECTLPVGPEGGFLEISLMMTDKGMQSNLIANSGGFVRWMEEETGFQIRTLLYPQESGILAEIRDRPVDLGDLCLFPMSLADVNKLAGDGVLSPMSTLIRDYAPAIQRMLDTQRGMVNAYTARDGGLYGLPAGRDETLLYPDDLGMRMWIRRDLMEQYRGMPSTTQEFRDFLRWVRDEDVDGDGDPANEIGWLTPMEEPVYFSRPTDFVMNAFALQNEDGFYVADNVIHCAMIEEGWREGLRYLAGLWSEGLLHPDSAKLGQSDLMRAVTDGTVACVSVNTRSTLSNDSEVRELYVPLPPLRGPSGLQNAYWDGFAGLKQVPGVRSGNLMSCNLLQTCAAMLPKDGTRQEDAMALLNLLYEDDTLLRARLGDEGSDWQYVTEEAHDRHVISISGQPARVELLGDLNFHMLWGRNWSEPFGQSHWSTVFPMVSRIMAALPQWLPSGFSGIPSDYVADYQAARLYESYVTPCSVPPLLFDEDTERRINGYGWGIATVCQTAADDFVQGRRDIGNDAEWAIYLAEVDAAGMNEVLDTMQTHFDARWVGLQPDVYIPKP